MRTRIFIILATMATLCSCQLDIEPSNQVYVTDIKVNVPQRVMQGCDITASYTVFYSNGQSAEVLAQQSVLDAAILSQSSDNTLLGLNPGTTTLISKISVTGAVNFEQTLSNEVEVYPVDGQLTDIRTTQGNIIAHVGDTVTLIPQARFSNGFMYTMSRHAFDWDIREQEERQWVRRLDDGLYLIVNPNEGKDKKVAEATDILIDFFYAVNGVSKHGFTTISIDLPQE